MKLKSKTSQQRQRERTPAGSGGGPGPQALLRAVTRFAIPLLVFCWPMLYLFRFGFGINGQYTAVGNDFNILYYKYKIYLLDCLASFHLPLWSPSEAAGFPFYTNPFAQMFYPLNALLVLWYKLFGGYNSVDHQLFTILGISIFSLGLFMWLKLINKDIKAVVFAVLIMSVSFKVTEITRFPNAVHSMAWYPWVLYALTRVMFSKSAKEAAKSAGLLALFGIFLCTAGYPYFVYYTIFLFFPYLLAFGIKPLRTRLFGEQAISFKRAAFAIPAAGFAALLLCLPHLVGVKRLMSQTIDRAGKDFQYSTSHIFNFEDTVGSLLYPPASSIEGWYFFSITALLIIAVYLFTCRRPIVNNETLETFPADTDSLWVKLFFVIWFGLITYISYGKNSYLFVLLWKYMPGFSSLRVWGRMNIVLVPILAWLLSIAYAHFSRMISGIDKAKGVPRRAATELAVLAAIYAAVLGVQLYMHLEGVRDPMWVMYSEGLAANELWFIIYGAIAAGAILMIMLISARKPLGGKWLTAAMAFMVVLAAVEMRHTGPHIWAYRSPHRVPRRVVLDVARLDMLSFSYARKDAPDSIQLTPVFAAGVLENWYFGRYVNFLKKTADQLPARNILMGIQSGSKIFFSERIDHPDIESFLRDASRFKQFGRLESYNGDELQLEVDAQAAGYLSFIDNWDPDWKAYVDGQPVQIELLFGTFKSVRLTQGKHNVRFCYQPGLFPAVSEKTIPDPFLEKKGS